MVYQLKERRLKSGVNKLNKGKTRVYRLTERSSISGAKEVNKGIRDQYLARTGSTS